MEEECTLSDIARCIAYPELGDAAGQLIWSMAVRAARQNRVYRFAVSRDPDLLI